MSRSMQLHYISVTAFSFTDLFFRSNYPVIKLPWECDDQLTLLRQWSGTAFILENKRYAINRSVCKNVMT